MTTQSTVDLQEVAKFSQLASLWWNEQGPLKTLHDINPTRMNFIKDHVDLKGLRVLDVGCGGGILCEGLASTGAIVTGLDVSEDAIACARTHAQQHQFNIDYVCQPIDAFEATPFDVITCMEMLEHVSEPALVIQQCARLLNEGGYLFLSTLNRTVTAYTTAIVGAEYLLNLLPRQTHDFDKFIKPSELAAIARAAGFDVVDLRGLAYNPFTRTAMLHDSVAVNYLIVCRKSE